MTTFFHHHPNLGALAIVGVVVLLYVVMVVGSVLLGVGGINDPFRDYPKKDGRE